MSNKDREQELKRLIKDGIDFIRHMMKEHGEFHPFGMIVDKKGRPQMISVWDDEEQTPSTAQIENIVSTYRQLAAVGLCKATGIFVDVRLRNPSTGATQDAIRISLEHVGRYCGDVIYPYSLKPDNTISLGPATSMRGERAIFSDA